MSLAKVTSWSLCGLVSGLAAAGGPAADDVAGEDVAELPAGVVLLLPQPASSSPARPTVAPRASGRSLLILIPATFGGRSRRRRDSPWWPHPGQARWSSTPRGLGMVGL